MSIQGVQSKKEKNEAMRLRLVQWRDCFCNRLSRKRYPSRKDRREFQALRRAIQFYLQQL